MEALSDVMWREFHNNARTEAMTCPCFNPFTEDRQDLLSSLQMVQNIEKAVRMAEHCQDTDNNEIKQKKMENLHNLRSLVLKIREIYVRKLVVFQEGEQAVQLVETPVSSFLDKSTLKRLADYRQRQARY